RSGERAGLPVRAVRFDRRGPRGVCGRGHRRPSGARRPYRHRPVGGRDVELRIALEELAQARHPGLHQVRGGHIDIAQSEAGMSRLRELFEGNAQFGYGPEDMQFLDAAETRSRINVDRAQGSIYFPGTAALDPALLTRGLARV